MFAFCFCCLLRVVVVFCGLFASVWLLLFAVCYVLVVSCLMPVACLFVCGLVIRVFFVCLLFVKYCLLVAVCCVLFVI